MKIRIIIALAFLISGTILFAQDEGESPFNRPRNNIYDNIFGGDASVSSLNYERLILVRSKCFFTGSLGIGYNKNVDEGYKGSLYQISHSQFMTIPHHITINVGKKRSFFEFGIGGTGIIGDANKNYYLYPIIGYRLHSSKPMKLNYRVYISFPFEGYKNVEFWWFPIGISVGGGF
jgi:hypothetical protein